MYHYTNYIVHHIVKYSFCHISVGNTTYDSSILVLAFLLFCFSIQQTSNCI